MSELPVDKKFPILVQITRAQHFAWHAAVKEMCPDVDTAAVADRMWEITGVDTAKSYLKRLDRDRPLGPQVAASVVWSSVCMGEDATLETSDDGREGFVRHADCPWFHWHERLGLLAEDRPGCDAWFRSTVDTINETLGTKLRFETVEALPEGGSCCLRRFWEE